MPTFTRLISARSQSNQRSTLFTLVLAGFAALALNMAILFIDTSGLAAWLGVPSGLLGFLWAMVASFGIISIHVLAVRRGLDTESRLLRKEAEAELSRSQERFVARVSHALRTPLTGIAGFGSLMRDAAVTPDEGFTPAEFIEPIMAETADLSRMIDDLLVSAQLDTDTIEVSLGEISGLETIEGVVRSMSSFGMPTTIESGDARLIADRSHLQHVIRNLLANAHRHGHGPVKVRSRVNGNRLLIEIVDSGPGIPADVEPWLFSTFPAGRWSPSLGLGLEVARRLCERMDAQISYRRIRGETCFRVSVPLAFADPRHNQFATHGGYIRETLRRMGKIGNGSKTDTKEVAR